MHRALSVVLCLQMSTACRDDADPVVDSDVSDEEALAAELLRRLNKTEYAYTIGDLFGIDPSEVDVERDILVDGFTNNALALFTSSKHIETYFTSAQTYGNPSWVTSKVDTCTDPDISCVEAAVEALGLLLFRRPADAAERDLWSNLWIDLITEESYSFQEAGALVVEGMLQSPAFLYRIDQQDPEAPRDSWEIATRLAYLLTQSTPDAELMAAAEDGSLLTAAGRQAQVARLQADEKFQRASRAFTGDWLLLDHVPDFVLGVRDLFNRAPGLTESAQRIVDDHIAAGEPLIDLITTRDMWMNAATAAYYGEDASFPGTPPEGPPFATTSDDDYRRGLLFHPAFLAALSAKTGESIVFRGVWMLEAFYCFEPPAPPATVVTEDFEAMFDEDATDREMSDFRMQDAACGGCHQLIDPLAYAFEPYNQKGAFDDDPALRTDGSLGTVDFETPAEFVEALATRPEVDRCMTENVAQFALGRPMATDEVDALVDLASGDDFVAQLQAVIDSRLFLGTTGDQP